MLQLLSFALFASILLLSIGVIVATIRAELPLILRALGIDPRAAPSLPRVNERRVRVTRQPVLRPAPRTALRAAA